MQGQNASEEEPEWSDEQIADFEKRKMERNNFV